MGVGSEGYRCRWARDRLPLLSGGELIGAERRKVERHLIACPGCRRHERSLSDVLGVLQAAASASTTGHDGSGAGGPSLWPSLARQIRESRREPASPLDALARFFYPPSPALLAAGFSAAVAVAALSAVGVRTWGFGRSSGSGRLQVVNPAPAPPEYGYGEVDPDWASPPPVPPVVVLQPPPPALTPLKSAAMTSDPPAAPVVDRTASRFDYDLDHGTPMGPESADVKASY